MAFNGREVFDLYGGEVKLEFEPETHTYWIGDRQIVGVTSISGMCPKQFLNAWYAKMSADEARKILERGISPRELAIELHERGSDGDLVTNHISLDEFLAGGEDLVERIRLGRPGMCKLDEVFVEDAYTRIQWAARNSIRRSADIGTTAHKYAEDAVNYKLGKLSSPPKKPVNKESASAADAFVGWVKETKVEFISSEEKIYSREFGYAGTCDLDCVIGGKRIIADLKTSKSVYTDHIFQVAAYRHARTEETGVEYEGAWIIRISKSDGRFTAKYYDGSVLDLAFKGFCGFLQAYRPWKDIDTMITESFRKSGRRMA